MSSLGNCNLTETTNFDFYKLQTLKLDIYLMAYLTLFLRQCKAPAPCCTKWFTAAGSFYKMSVILGERICQIKDAHRWVPQWWQEKWHVALDPKPARNQVTQKACKKNNLSCKMLETPRFQKTINDEVRKQKKIQVFNWRQKKEFWQEPHLLSIARPQHPRLRYFKKYLL